MDTPPGGSQPSLTDSRMIAISPSQKPGVEYSSSAASDSARSSQRPAKLAITAPSAMPAASAQASALPISSTVLPRRLKISSDTGRL